MSKRHSEDHHHNYILSAFRTRRKHNASIAALAALSSTIFCGCGDNDAPRDIVDETACKLSATDDLVDQQKCFTCVDSYLPSDWNVDGGSMPSKVSSCGSDTSAILRSQKYDSAFKHWFKGKHVNCCNSPCGNYPNLDQISGLICYYDNGAKAAVAVNGINEVPQQLNDCQICLANNGCDWSACGVKYPSTDPIVCRGVGTKGWRPTVEGKTLDRCCKSKYCQGEIVEAGEL